MSWSGSMAVLIDAAFGVFENPAFDDSLRLDARTGVMVFQNLGNDLDGLALRHTAVTQSGIGIQDDALAFAGIGVIRLVEHFDAANRGGWHTGHLFIDLVFEFTAIELKAVVHQLEPHFAGNTLFQFFKGGILELDHLPGFEVDQVVVVLGVRFVA